VRDPFTARKLNQRVGDMARLEPHNLRTEFFREAYILLQSGVVFRLDPPRFFARRLDIDGIPIGRESAGDARTCAQQLLRTAARRKKWSGTVARTRTPVVRATASFSDSRC